MTYRNELFLFSKFDTIFNEEVIEIMYAQRFLAMHMISTNAILILKYDRTEHIVIFSQEDLLHQGWCFGTGNDVMKSLTMSESTICCFCILSMQTSIIPTAVESYNVPSRHKMTDPIYMKWVLHHKSLYCLSLPGDKVDTLVSSV